MNDIAGRLDILIQLINAGLIKKDEIIQIWNMANLNLEEFDKTVKERFDIMYSTKFKDLING